MQAEYSFCLHRRSANFASIGYPTEQKPKVTNKLKDPPSSQTELIAYKSPCAMLPPKELSIVTKDKYNNHRLSNSIVHDNAIIVFSQPDDEHPTSYCLQ